MIITRERVRELQETGVLGAWLNGKEWQWRDQDVVGMTWHTSDNLDSPFIYGESTEFRLKPKPIALWVPEFDEGGKPWYGSGRVSRIKWPCDPTLKLVRWHLMVATEDCEP